MSRTAVRILLVDDDVVDRLAVRRALLGSRLLAELTEMEDADSALAELETSSYDCALLDLQMPGKTGLELLRELRESGNDVAVIVLTGHGDEETVVEIMRSGAHDYLSKSLLSSERLQRTVEQALRVRRAEREAHVAHATLRRYADQLSSLADAASHVNGQLSVSAVTAALAERARTIIGARVAVVRTVAAGEAAATYAVSSGDGANDSRNSSPPPGENDLELDALNRCLRLAKDELEANPRAARLAHLGGMRAPVRGWLAAPLTSFDGRRFGLLHLSDKIEGEFSETDESILVQLAQMASVAIGNAWLFEAAQAATRAREDMIAVVSHDLRNPLNVVLMGSTLLLDLVSGNAPLLATAQRIQRSAEQMARLISDLLDVARIDSKSMTVAPLPHPPGTLAEEAVESVRPLAAKKGVRLVTALSARLPVVLADRDRIGQVLGNLIGNAIKFTPAGGSITVGAEPEDGKVTMFVADTGSGISADHLPRLFDRFWQSRETAALGAGLGLFIAKGLVEAHGGSIWAESGAGGSKFSFTLAVDETPAG